MRKKGNSKYWYACFSDESGKQCQRSTGIADRGNPSSRADARRTALRIAEEFEETAQGSRSQSQIRNTLKDLYERVNPEKFEFTRTDKHLNAWAERAGKLKAPRTAEKYQGVVAAFLKSLSTRSKSKLSDLTVKDFQDFIDNQLNSGKSPQSVASDARILSIPFNVAFKQGLILQNPVAAVELPEAAHESRKPFTWAQVQSLINEAQGDWKTAIMLGAYTGARLGDCIDMKWQNIDLQKNEITFVPSKTSRGKKRKELILPLHRDLEEHLMPLAGDDPKAYLSPTLANRNIGGRKGLSVKFQEIMHRAGIDQETGLEKTGKGRVFKRYGFHSLRHTFNSELANHGVKQEIRKIFTGHSSDRMNDQYTKYEPEKLREAIENLPRIES